MGYNVIRLNAVKQKILAMEKPTILIDKKCPFCDRGDLYLTTEKFKHIPKDKPYTLKGDWYFYKCTECKEKFTTTESDTISQNNLNKKRVGNKKNNK
jgi:hypothetical protein